MQGVIQEVMDADKKLAREHLPVGNVIDYRQYDESQELLFRGSHFPFPVTHFPNIAVRNIWTCMAHPLWTNSCYHVVVGVQTGSAIGNKQHQDILGNPLGGSRTGLGGFVDMPAITATLKSEIISTKAPKSI